MKTSISRLAIIALLFLQAWAAQAHGGDRQHGGSAGGESREDLFRLGRREDGGRGRDDLFRLDGGRRDGGNPFSLDGGRRDGRRDGGAGIIKDGFRPDGGRARADGHRGAGYRRDGRHDGRQDGGHYEDGHWRGEAGGLRASSPGRHERPDALRRVRDDYRDGRRHDDFMGGRPGDDHRHLDYDDRRRHSGPHVRHEVRHVVHHLPPRHAVILHGRERYHYHDGRFYRPWNAGFILVRPPLGLVVLSLPLGSRTVISAGITFHVFGDVYYRRVPAGYEVVEPIRPAGREWPTRVSVVTDLLNLRYGPDEREQVIAQAGRYTVLNVIGGAPGWLYVEIDGQDMRGWVMERYVTADIGRG